MSGPGTNAHYCPGLPGIRVGFLFSAPGRLEEEKGAPVAGVTGANLDAALAWLHANDPAAFPSADRYDYRITNAFAEVLYEGMHGRTEATKAEVLAPENLARVRAELSGVEAIVLCGGKACLVRPALEAAGRPPDGSIRFCYHVSCRPPRFSCPRKKTF